MIDYIVHYGKQEGLNLNLSDGSNSFIKIFIPVRKIADLLYELDDNYDSINDTDKRYLNYVIDRLSERNN